MYLSFLSDCPVLLILLSLSYWLPLAAGQDRGNVDADEAETVWMPDANLRKAVRDKLGIKADDTLTKTKMTELTGLWVPNVESPLIHHPNEY